MTQKWKTPDKTTVVALTITAKLSTPIFRPHSILLSQFAQAKADLGTLNSDIDAEIEKNKSVISTLTSKNTELASLKSNNEGSIKTFAKFLK